MKTCQYCYSSFDGDFCEDCVESHRRVSSLTVVGSRARKKGSPNLDVQEGNRKEYFGDCHEMDD